MKSIRYIYWQDGDMWLGHLEDYPDYHTQGESLEDLQEHLKDLLQDLTSGVIPNVKRVGELQIA
jgi:predicted RNase H-like HicB family nuclease